MGETAENSRPALTQEDVEFVLHNQFGISKDSVEVIKPLDSYDDQNFYVRLRPGARELLLKITNWKDSKNVQLIVEMTEVMFRLSETVACSKPLTAKNGSFIGHYVYTDGNHQKRDCIVRMFNFLPGNVMRPGTVTRAQAFQWGSLLGKMHSAFESMDKFPVLEERYFLWSWEGVIETKCYVKVVSDNDHRTLVEEIFSEYENQVFPRLKQMEQGLLHGDLNERNILANNAGEVYAVLDLGDAQGGPRIWDLALVLAYLSIVTPNAEEDLLDYLGQAITGYASHMPQVVEETCDVETIRLLVCARLCQSMVLGLRAFEITKDPYVLTTQKRGWPVLKQFYSEPRERISKVWNELLKPYKVTMKSAAN